VGSLSQLLWGWAKAGLEAAKRIAQKAMGRRENFIMKNNKMKTRDEIRIRNSYLIPAGCFRVFQIVDGRLHDWQTQNYMKLRRSSVRRIRIPAHITFIILRNDPFIL
jgi:hypothetical protein